MYLVSSILGSMKRTSDREGKMSDLTVHSVSLAPLTSVDKETARRSDSELKREPSFHRLLTLSQHFFFTIPLIQAESHPAVIGSPIGRHTIGPASSGFGQVGRHCK